MVSHACFFFFRDMVLDGKNECAKLHFTRHKIIVNVYNLLLMVWGSKEGKQKVEKLAESTSVFHRKGVYQPAW